MSSTGVTLVVSALAGGAVAATIVFVGSAPRAAEEGPAPVAPVAPTVEAELLARVDALTEENRELLERVMQLELRPAADERSPAQVFATRDELDAFREEIHGWLAQLDTSNEPDTFKRQVADTLSAIRKEERVAAVRKGQEMRLERLNEDVAKIEEWLELDSYQVVEMRAALLAQYEREDEVRRLWEEGVDDETLGEQKRDAGERFRADLGRFLTQEQRETFWNRRGRGGKD
jgi:hypothetical protein